jgi:hypothetical protein
VCSKKEEKMTDYLIVGTYSSWSLHVFKLPFFLGKLRWWLTRTMIVWFFNNSKRKAVSLPFLLCPVYLTGNDTGTGNTEVTHRVKRIFRDPKAFAKDAFVVVTGSGHGRYVSRRTCRAAESFFTSQRNLKGAVLSVVR